MSGTSRITPYRRLKRILIGILVASIMLAAVAIVRVFVQDSAAYVAIMQVCQTKRKAYLDQVKKKQATYDLAKRILESVDPDDMRHRDLYDRLYRWWADNGWYFVDNTGDCIGVEEKTVPDHIERLEESTRRLAEDNDDSRLLVCAVLYDMRNRDRAKVLAGDACHTISQTEGMR